MSRMVHTLLVNAHRTHELWPIFLAHVLEVRQGGGPSHRGEGGGALLIKAHHTVCWR